jgi:hypothetical protein
MELVMQDIWKNFPYNCADYDSRFINKKVILAIREFCERNSIIERFYAKGSITYGCMIPGSDIDHVRIKLREKINREEKEKIVDELENVLKKFGIIKLRRIREDNYARFFCEWEELSELPNAKTEDSEIWPELKIMTAKNEFEWFLKILITGYSYMNEISLNWIGKIWRRIFENEV